MRVLFAENHDSFSWNVIDCLPVARDAVQVVSGACLAQAPDRLGEADLLIVGPGPTDPIRAGLVGLVTEAIRRRLPTLGICLGHQAIGLACGATLARTLPAHGKVDRAHFQGSRWLPEILGDYQVMRYHSLSLTRVPAPLHVVATNPDNLVMAVAHESLPLVGLQFHPDSFATPQGPTMVAAFFRACG